MILPDSNPTIHLDQAAKTAIIRDGSGGIEMRLNFAKGCVLDRLKVRGRETASPEPGIWTGCLVAGKWHTTAHLNRTPVVEQKGNLLLVRGIEYGGSANRIKEGWTFTVRKESVSWKIDRQYTSGVKIEATAMPSMTFRSMKEFDGALLGTGGVAWCRLLDSPNATYGVHDGSARFWNSSSDAFLALTARSSGAATALTYSRDPEEQFSVTASSTREALEPKHGFARFLRDRTDVWKGFQVAANEKSAVELEFRAASLSQELGRGDFKGLDTKSITELANTIGRIGVIDGDLVGSNGWYSGYICMHEPWLARVGTAINDENYTQSVGRFLDRARLHAIQPDGMVKSRWKYDAGDAQPGTYDPATGFYEAQWGRLMDSQSSYVTNVADQFDESGDLEWLKRQKASCEAALDYLLRRDKDGDGLVEMENSLTSQRRSSDWLDIVWASHENAFVNAQLYGALVKWSAIEAHLGDRPRAQRYEEFAAKLKSAFNRSTDEGGFWDQQKGWYAYWRDADGSVHGTNLVVPVNLTAIVEGIASPPQVQEILERMDQRMDAESLVAWPACFESYAPGEGADDVFPTYENGDVFLAWAEYGIQAYAKTMPEVALKYLRRIIDQYKKDGLAFQRYLRKDGRGAGDDILANNCNALTGLYRGIYGIQPKHNRLYLEPHLVEELNGTHVRYGYRGHRLDIELSVRDYLVRSGSLAVRSPGPFGVWFRSNSVDCFAGGEAIPTLTVQGSGKNPVELTFEEWGGRKLWSLLTPKRGATLTHTFHGLPAGGRFVVRTAGKQLGTVDSASPSLRISTKAGVRLALELEPIP